MRFAGLALYEAVPAAETIWLFHEQLVRAGAIGEARATAKLVPANPACNFTHLARPQARAAA